MSKMKTLSVSKKKSDKGTEISWKLKGHEDVSAIINNGGVRFSDVPELAKYEPFNGNSEVFSIGNLLFLEDVQYYYSIFSHILRELGNNDQKGETVKTGTTSFGNPHKDNIEKYRSRISDLKLARLPAGTMVLMEPTTGKILNSNKKFSDLIQNGRVQKLLDVLFDTEKSTL